MSDTQGTWKGSAPFGTGWNADVVEAVGSDLAINNGTIDVTAITADTLWGNPQTIAAKPTPVAIGPGLTLPATGTLAAQWQTGTVVSKVGSDLSVNSGTIDIAAITAASLFGNPGTAAAKPSAIAIGSGLTLSAVGTLSNTGILSLVAGTNVTITGSNTISATGGGGSGTVTQVVAGAGLAGGTITTAGTISAQWQGGTVTAIGPEFVEPSGTLHYDQMATYISASATIDTTYFGKNLVDNSAGTSDIVLTLTTLAAATHLTFSVQNNSAHHYVRLRPATGVFINGVSASDYLLPNFTGGSVAIDSTGTAYTTGAALSFWNPSAGYVTSLNGLKITNDGTFSTNGTLTPVVDGSSIILSGGTLSVPASVAAGTFISFPRAATKPSAAGFTLTVGGTSNTTSISDLASGRGMLWDHPANSSGSTWLDYAKYNSFSPPAAGTDFTVKACVSFNSSNLPGGGWAFGLAFRDNAGKLVQYGPRNGGSAATASVPSRFTYTSATVFNGFTTLTSANQDTPPGSNPYWMRLQRIGTNIVYSTSFDGETWVVTQTDSATFFIGSTIQDVGLFGFINNLTGRWAIDVWDFETSTP